MSSFNREDRYIVIKRSDVETFWRDDVREQFMSALERLNEHHVRIPQRRYLVIESDWPEYGPVWQMIEQRMTGSAPVVERQPVGQIRNDIERANCLWFGTLPPHGTNLYTVAPELAELQATLAKQAAENEAVKYNLDKTDKLYLAAVVEIERLKGGQGEPVAWIKEHWSGKSADFHYKTLVDVVFKDDWKPLYTSQPAPVSAEYRLHMGEALKVFEALKSEQTGRTVLNEHLGPMGATEVETWDTHIGVTLEMQQAMGGCTLVVRPASVSVVMSDEQILEAMREHIYAADGGYVFDTAKDDVIAAGRALLDKVKELNK